MQKIINPKPPTKTDLRVLAFLNEGNRIDGAKAIGVFRITGIRDVIYRLRCAGNDIKFEDISYVSKDGNRKTYREWYTQDYKIVESGKKVGKERLRQAEMF